MVDKLELIKLRLEPLELENLSVNYGATSKDKTDKKMTTVVGIKSSNSIIISSDSQGTNDSMKSLEISKIFQINESIGVGLAGDIGYINTVVDTLKEKLGTSQYRRELDLRQALDGIVCELFKKYNVERSKSLGFGEPMSLFDVPVILDAKLGDGTFVLYRIRLSPKPWVYIVENYAAIGTGEVYAELLMRQQLRAVPAGLELNPINYNIWISMVTVNEIKAIEPNTGGTTHVAIIDESGFRIMEKTEVVLIYNQYRRAIAEQVAQRFNISVEQAEALYPDP
jgi:20S proteasome alpha/beta subunit